MPDLFVFDLVVPGMNPRETLSDLRQRYPKSSIMIISMLDETATVKKVMDYGANAFVVTSIPAAEMFEALMAVRSGEYVVARPNAAADSGQDSDVRNVMDLTTRQREILAMLRDGQSNKEIARTLALSPFTIRNHISLLMRILNVHSRLELASKADTQIH